MTSAQILLPTDAPAELEPTIVDRATATVDAAAPTGNDEAARISFRQPVSGAGFIDAAWWPRSLDLVAELRPLLDVMWTASREISRVTYNLGSWDPAPRRVRIEDRIVRLGGFTTIDPLTVRLSDAWGSDSIDILVVPPKTDPEVAERALRLASVADSPYHAKEILDQASESTVP